MNTDEKDDIYETYQVLDQIGRGSYASVHRAINKKTGEICAIKKIPSMMSDVSNFIIEIGIISQNKCDNIVRYLASDCSEEEALIVMEYCCGGSVKDAMRQLNRTMNAEQITVITKDVLQGLEYLHSIQKIHRDVKAANILLDEHGTAKLGDFGVSEQMDPEQKKNSIVGTPLWLPPEVIRHEDYSFTIDIWSLGITIIEMGDGQPPYSDLDQKDALREIGNIKQEPPTFRDSSKWPKGLVDFVAKCLVKDAGNRPNARDLLKHPMIKGVNSNESIRRLVAEVCSSTANLTESKLFLKSYYSFVESIQLLNIIHARRKNVIRVDHLSDSYLKINREFEGLLSISEKHKDQIKEARKQLELATVEVQGLEQMKNKLEDDLKTLKNHKSDLQLKIDKINNHHGEIERRMKLKSLESR